MAVCPKCKQDVAESEALCSSCGEPVRSVENPNPSGEYAAVKPQGFAGIAYYIPWTLLLPIACFILGWGGNDFFYLGLYGRLATAYLYGILPPLIAYWFLKGDKRPIAYKIHAAWFIGLVLFFLLDYRANLMEGTIITPHLIWIVHFGLKWSSIPAGRGASIWLLACVLIGISYFCEKRAKEKWRRTQYLVPGSWKAAAGSY